MSKEVNSYISLSADDAKLLKRTESVNDCKNMAKDLFTMYEWSKTWKVEFSAKQCQALEYLR